VLLTVVGDSVTVTAHRAGPAQPRKIASRQASNRRGTLNVGAFMIISSCYVSEWVLLHELTTF
jgi:hypothetical protein